MKLVNKKFLTIFFLGASCGLPLALILSTLKAFLLEKNFGLAIIGFLSILSLPYSIKFCFAPFIDSIRIPILNNLFARRKSWIIFSQILLIISLSLLGFAGESQKIILIIIFGFLSAIFSAFQDIAVDGYRIENFNQENQGLAASTYIFGYRIGLLISGALALFLAEIMKWSYVYLIMSLFMALFLLITLFCDEKSFEIRRREKSILKWLKDFVIEPFADFIKQNRWYAILLFVILFKLGDAFAGSLAIPFFLEIGFSKTEIATIVKTFGLLATLLGVFCGGFLVKKLKMKNSLLIAIVIQALSNLSYAYLANIGYEIKSLYLVIFIENFSGGIGDAVFVAYLSMLCNIRFSATQYAILSSFAGLSRALFSSSAGIVVANIGWYQFFIFSIFLSIPTLLCLLLIKKYMKQ